jgi:hypothetical protein
MICIMLKSSESVTVMELMSRCSANDHTIMNDITTWTWSIVSSNFKLAAYNFDF